MTNGENHYVRIGVAEVYTKLESVDDKVSDMKREFDSVIRDHNDLIKRVRNLELRFYGILAGVVAAAGSLWLGLVRGVGG